jgi:hypothetical protein
MGVPQPQMISSITTKYFAGSFTLPQGCNEISYCGYNCFCIVKRLTLTSCIVWLSALASLRPSAMEAEMQIVHGILDSRALSGAAFGKFKFFV